VLFFHLLVGLGGILSRSLREVRSLDRGRGNLEKTCDSRTSE
jgi:hypothetical protein